MNTQCTSNFSRLALTAGMIGLFSASAPAATVSINQTALSGGNAVAGARLRASNDAWDVGLTNGRGYSRVDSRRGGLSRNFVTPGRTYTFTLEHRAGQGYIFTVRDNRTGRTSAQAWGTFTNPPATRNLVSTLGGQLPNSSFNALQIDTRATIAGARTSFSNLVFTGADLNSNGSFYNGSLTRTTTIGSQAAGTDRQSLLADVDLSRYSWTISGTVGLSRGVGINGADDVSLSISVLNVPVNAPTVPEPAGTALAGAALAGLLVRRRRA